MKINKKNPKHLVIVFLTTVNAAVALLLRPLLKKQTTKKSVIFFGHTLNGNLRSVYDKLSNDPGYEVYFLGINKKYIKSLEESGEEGRCLLTTNTMQMLKLSKADAVISSHGIQVLALQRKFTSTKFIDVWHGIPYKGFDAEDFKEIHDHDQIWVSSPELKNMYVEKFGFKESKLKVTGYSRVDQLIDRSLNKEELLEKYEIPKANKYVLIAPTWQQDDSGRNIVPYGVSNEQFFAELDEIALRNKARFIFRTHLNSGDDLDMPVLKAISFMPYVRYENAEEFLFLSDILVTDWSSIAFDYLPLDRPTIFLDVEAPFKKGFSLGPEYRFGKVARTFSELKITIDTYLSRPIEYREEYNEEISKTKKVVYGNTLDGKSTERCVTELNKLLME